MKRSAQGKAFRRYVERRERELGRVLMKRYGTGKAKRYGISRTTIKKHLPELIEDRYERVARRVEQAVQRVKENLDETIDERIEQHPVIHTLQQRSEETIGLVASLATQVERLSKHAGT